MLKRKTYDILSWIFVGLFVLLVLFNILLPYFILKNSGNNPTAVFPLISLVYTLSIPFVICLYIYNILVIILAIQLYKKNLLSITDTIFICILFSFNLIFYLFLIRKKLKKYEEAESFNSVSQ